MKAELLISGVSAGASTVAAAFVYWQIRKHQISLRAQLFTTIIDAIHQHDDFQSVLGYLIANKICARIDPATNKTRLVLQEGEDVTEQVDKFLSRFQIIGHLVFLKVLDQSNLQTIHFELLAAGRNQAIRQYLQYLITRFIQQSGIIHDHFEFFKRLYLDCEYEQPEKDAFSPCLFVANREQATRPRIDELNERPFPGSDTR